MEFYGLLGEKLSHSLSPQIHSEILKLIDREGDYKLFEVKEKNLQEFTKALKILKIKGANVTIPYKEEIIKHIDSISKEAER
ncbi:shikimate dehydrogenase, partial [Clostridium perfringens]|nr:shikimate dehydrogenase [Clostridium perfringens]